MTRRELQSELKNIFLALKRTVVLVTHDLHEAAWFGDDIVLMRDGRVVQRGTLQDLLEDPAEPFVTEFLQLGEGFLGGHGGDSSGKAES